MMLEKNSKEKIEKSQEQ
jgi:hypothetical protein